MSCRNFIPVMNTLKDAIHNDITASLDAIKANFESKGLAFDEKFRNLFCRSISNRLTEVFDIFEMEVAESTRKRERSISNVSTESKRRKCGDDILSKWAFTCAHCYLTHQENNWYTNVKKVRKHWQNDHVKDDLPFRFYVDCRVKCYRCQLVGFSERIQHHARTKHKEFAVFVTGQRESREQQCAFCVHREWNGNLPDHFRRVHSDELVSMDALNLIPISYRDLMDLNAIGNFNLRCLYCKRTYANSNDFDQHHRAKHPGEQQKRDEVQLICCLCEMCIRGDEFLVHVQKCGILKCNKCQHFQAKTPEIFLDHIKEMHSNDLNNGFYSSLRRSLMGKYLSMRCIFENGLVLIKRNLVSSCFDDRNEFMNLIAESVSELRTLAERSGSNKI